VSIPIQQSRYDKSVRELRAKFTDPRHQEEAVSAFSDNFEVLPDDHPTFKPYVTPTEPKPAVAPATAPKPDEKAERISAAASALLEADEVAVEAKRLRIERVVNGANDPSVTAADLRAYIESQDESVITEHVTADPLVDAFNALSPDEVAAFNAERGITAEDLARKGGPDTDRVEANARNREVLRQATADREAQIAFFGGDESVVAPLSAFVKAAGDKVGTTREQRKAERLADAARESGFKVEE
jgi:hypothetical protein